MLLVHHLEKDQEINKNLKDFQKEMYILEQKNISLSINYLVDTMVNTFIHKGLPPHQLYHGRTQRIFNVNKKAINV